jgi:N-acyl homoserine lactone hydrolase
MRRRMLGLAAGAMALMGMQAPTPPPPAARPEISLWRLDCGSAHISDLDTFSDTHAYVGRQKTLTASCYLIRNGDRYLLWDTGLPGALADTTATPGGYSLRVRIRDQLARIGVRPEQVSFVGISHYHGDHTGQVADFPGATLLIGAPDWEVIRARPEEAAKFGPWIERGATVRAVPGDHDVFGDGSVVMLNMPGHTPGHHALLVRLPRTGPVLLTGDLYHFTENFESGGIPGFNHNRADTLASMARFREIARNLRARIIIQHEPNDIAKLPAFPEAAR